MTITNIYLIITFYLIIIYILKLYFSINLKDAIYILILYLFCVFALYKHTIMEIIYRIFLWLSTFTVLYFEDNREKLSKKGKRFLNLGILCYTIVLLLLGFFYHW